MQSSSSPTNEEKSDDAHPRGRDSESAPSSWLKPIRLGASYARVLRIGAQGSPRVGRTGEREHAIVAPMFLFGVLEWLAEFLASVVGVSGVRAGVLAVVVVAVLYGARLAGWLKLAGSWLYMTAVIGGVFGGVLVLGMASGAVTIDAAAAWDLLAGLLEVLH